ncbi:MAG: phosphate acetyltransferase [Deltaproteobacteria bacterium]|nr:phosphate acetyltransferase [Deltaproteobacteria bacterium]
MSGSLFITATEARSGKSLISLGVMEMLHRKIDRVGFFRPLINGEPESNERDNDIELISTRFNLGIPYDKMYAYTTSEANRLISIGREADLIGGVIKKYNELRKDCDFILCEGTDFAGSTAAFEFDINAEISKNLACPVLLVANAHRKSKEDTLKFIELALESLHDKGCRTIATIVNRINPDDGKAIVDLLDKSAFGKGQVVFTIPDEVTLGKPTVGEIARIVGAEVIYGEEQLDRHVHGFTVAAMQLRNFLERIERGSLIITPGDRADVIVACLAVVSSTSMENISGILLTGGLKPEEPVRNLIKGFARMVPILSVKENTFPTATIVDKIHATISPHDDRKIIEALAVFEKNVNVEMLAEKIITARTAVVTPKMFEYELLQKARKQKQHIVLPEGEEERILRASEVLLQRDVVDITLLGNAQTIREKISQMSLKLEKANIVEPPSSDMLQEYAETYYGLRKHKGITRENARDVMSDATYFGTMMIHKGHADGMVSGSVHSTAATVRPAFEIIKTKQGFSIVSSVFLMCLADRVLVYGDCAVNPNPDARQLAEIALSSAQTAQTFGIHPIVAMLSYSTGESGKGEDVERVREATKIAKEKAEESFPDLKIEGPLQYDAAVDPGVARTKMPDSEVAGKATVFIFPDLNTGNNTYKAVQRSAGAVAIGPVLQGLKHPVNDLSRGCTIPDIVNTVAITAVQAQSEKGLS